MPPRGRPEQRRRRFRLVGGGFYFQYLLHVHRLPFFLFTRRHAAVFTSTPREHIVHDTRPVNVSALTHAPAALLNPATAAAAAAASTASVTTSPSTTALQKRHHPVEAPAPGHERDRRARAKNHYAGIKL